ncbi:MAG: PIN domain-containing protein [Elusimicrobia bacterium]|nr:PIN domain-containing protein [Elusimicrobiota bacterium]
MAQVLVDTSVWIDMFRDGGSCPSQALGKLLGHNLACINGLIRAEILSGARSQSEYRRRDPPCLWDEVALARYRLARRGFQESIADLIVATTAVYHKKSLFTLDGAFRRIRSVLPIELLEL